MRWLIALSIIMLVAPASALNEDAPPWSPDATLLYLDSDDAANGDAEVTGFINTVKDDGDDAALGPSGNCATHTGEDVDFTLVPPETDTDLTYTLPLLPAQPGMATIEGPVAASLHIGAGSCYGEVDITARLVAAGATVAEGGVTDHRYNDASGNYPLAAFELEIVQATFPSDDLALEVQVTGKTGGAVFMGIGESRGFSSIDVPLVSLTPAVDRVFAYHDVTDDALAIALDWNGTSRTDQYNWTNGEANLTYFATGELTGNATLTVTDGNGTVVHEDTLSGAVNASMQLGGAPGTWNITVVATDANGTVSLLLSPLVPEAPAPGEPAEPGTPEGEEEGAPGEADEGEESPGMGVLVLPLLAAIALLRRR